MATSVGRSDLGGIMVMMPAFTTDDAGSYAAEHTVDLSRLSDGVEKFVTAGVDVICTTGSYGEGYNLLFDEYKSLVQATVEAVDSRAVVIVGCVGSNAREIVAKAKFVGSTKADGILLGLPNYFPLSLDNALRFVKEVAETVAPMPIMLYHNPLLHRTRIPAAAIPALLEKNVIALKDSHRDTRGLMEVLHLSGKKLRVFVSCAQYYPYAELGAAGAWSIEASMGPAPVVALRDAIRAGDVERAIEITREITNVKEGEAPDLRWREVGDKIAAREAGFLDPGPLRTPYLTVPPEVAERAKARAAYWRSLQHKYAASTQRVGALSGRSSTGDGGGQ